ncbi:MAG: hypothetical protein M3N82_10755 [Pseudomonadota bacterium]|nr:hypothetical protein [Pseudomonadota bacterium]
MKNAPPAAPAPTQAGKPERWRIDAGDADVATLVIPADSFRTRRFEIDCRLVVAPLAAGAHHAMRVDVDGGLEWTRRAPTENPGHTDSMDYHFRRELPAGKPLRIVVKTEARQARRMRLVIEAEEG